MLLFTLAWTGRASSNETSTVNAALLSIVLVMFLHPVVFDVPV